MNNRIRHARRQYLEADRLRNIAARRAAGWFPKTCPVGTSVMYSLGRHWVYGVVLMHGFGERVKVSCANGSEKWINGDRLDFTEAARG